MKQALPNCPIAAAIMLVGNKWKIQIIRELLLDTQDGKRFSQIKAGIENISDKMLSQSLKELEEDHLLQRKVLDTAPPRTEYTLTEMGQGLANALMSLYKWGTAYKSMYGSEPLQQGEELT